jgi:hypothetical protein
MAYICLECFMEQNGILQLSRDKVVRRLERGAQRRLNMCARDLVEAYRAGHLEEPGAVGDLLALASLLVATDPLFVPA